MLECNSFENLSVTLQYSSETKFCYEKVFTTVCALPIMRKGELRHWEN